MWRTAYARPTGRGRDGGSVAVLATPRCLTVAASDSGGGAGVQADLKAFAAAGCHGTCAITAVTAQSTVGVLAVHEVPAAAVVAQLEAVVDDIGVDAVKTGALGSAGVVAAVAAFLRDHPVPLVVDPVVASSTGARLISDDGLAALVSELLPLATVATPNLAEAEALTGVRGDRRELAEAVLALGCAAVVVTGGHGEPPVDHLHDGRRHVDIPVARHPVATTHGAGCTHSATLAALLARGASLDEAARGAAAAASGAVARGLDDIGRGDGPVDVLGIASLGGARHG